MPQQAEFKSRKRRVMRGAFASRGKGFIALLACKAFASRGAEDAPHSSSGDRFLIGQNYFSSKTLPSLN